MAPTTIQISQELKQHLDHLRLSPRETYENVIDRMVEEFEEFNEQTKKDIAKAEAAYRSGRVVSHERVKKELGLL